MKQVSWKEKTARKLIMWLLRYVPEWIVVHKRKWGKLKAQNRILAAENSHIKTQACQVIDLAEGITGENKRLRAEIEQLKENVAVIAVEEVKAENNQLRAAYDALLEEMEELRNG